MHPRDERQYLARSTWNGGIYHIYESEYKSDPQDWEILTAEEVKEHYAGKVLDSGLEVETKQPEPEEIEEVSVLGYHELKDMLTKLGIPFKGNARKSELVELLEENT